MGRRATVPSVKTPGCELEHRAQGALAKVRPLCWHSLESSRQSTSNARTRSSTATQLLRKWAQKE
eukprot:scaffold321020_cov22-Tisochrysis_lutea.AAC.3